MTPPAPTPEAFAIGLATAVIDKWREDLARVGATTIPNNGMQCAAVLRDALTASEARVKELESNMRVVGRRLNDRIEYRDARIAALEAEVKGLREALEEISRIDNVLVWTGGPESVPSHNEQGECAKIALAALDGKAVGG